MSDPAPSLFVTDAGQAAALLAGLRGSPVERAAVLYLDPEWRLLGRADFTGTLDRVTPPFRTIFAAALRLDAAALVFAHSHPHGNSEASAPDIAFTRALIRMAAALDIVVADHLIVAGDAVTSLRDAGLM
ncbi:DNA repair protein RadC [Sphingomonas insulae]|uniref:MPN domain-containing protein n=1 Tax=Sphingomonas insulae TaxID=424800 RepID=A0ABP3SZV8_9SPHN|nr:JAB domain-containing protein [Sphingomonas insulae]NIJ31299.1 DNA repair protein RadC [Sphingomonas insulae]